MSNFKALTRKKGTQDEPKWATWIDNYFGKRHYGVRFLGAVSVLDGNEYEQIEPIVDAIGSENIGGESRSLDD